MNQKYGLAKLSNLLERVERFEEVDPFEEYHFAGTFSFARGIFAGERKLGSDFKLPKVQRIHEGDFVYCKIMAWEGAFGLVPKEAHNCVMSGAFVAYEVDRTQIDPNYLANYFKVPSIWKLVGGQSTGTNVRRRSLHPLQFENTNIPLPPLEEQQRIVAQLEVLAARIEEARGLRKQLREDCNALCRSILADTSDGMPTLTPMRELVRLREPDIPVSPEEIYWFAGVYSFGRGLFQGQLKSGAEFAYNRLTRLRTDNFVYPKLMAWEGAFAVVPRECDGLVVSPEFPVFEIDQRCVLPETLDVYFRMPSVWSAVSGASTGTNVRRRRLNPADFLVFEIPLPHMKTQKRLREVKAKLDQISQLQAKTSAELDALLPSILDKAFKGDL